MIGQRIGMIERVDREVGLGEPALREQRSEHVDGQVAALHALGEVDARQPACLGLLHACGSFPFAGVGRTRGWIGRARLLHGGRQRQRLLCNAPPAGYATAARVSRQRRRIRSQDARHR